MTQEELLKINFSAWLNLVETKTFLRNLREQRESLIREAEEKSFIPNSDPTLIKFNLVRAKQIREILDICSNN